MADLSVNKSDTTGVREDVGQNLVINGDFENVPPFTAVTKSTGGRWIDGTASGSSSDTDLYGWAIATSNSNTAAQAFYDTTVSHSGSASLKVSTTGTGIFIQVHSSRQDSNASRLLFRYAATPNTSYTFSGWMKTNYVSGDSNNGAILIIQEIDNVGIDSGDGYSSPNVKVTQGWTFYTSTFTTGSTTGGLEVRFFIYGQTGAGTLIMDAWFDDIYLQKATPTAGLMANENITVSDTVTASENIQLLVMSFVNVNDALATSESIKLLSINSISISDTTSISESVKAAIQTAGNVSDTATTSESINVLIPTLLIFTSDTTTIGENAVASQFTLIAVFDSSIITSENLQVFTELFVSVNDLISISDAITLVIAFLLISVFNRLFVTENMQLIAKIPVFADTVIVSENLQIFIASDFIYIDSISITLPNPISLSVIVSSTIILEVIIE